MLTPWVRDRPRRNSGSCRSKNVASTTVGVGDENETYRRLIALLDAHKAQCRLIDHAPEAGRSW
jgi:hypothetical protein